MLLDRVIKLKNEILAEFPKDEYFNNFEATLDDKIVLCNWEVYEKIFQNLDEKAWQILKEKSKKHFKGSRVNNWKEPFFNHLNEAFGYSYLLKMGFSDIQYIEDLKKKNASVPDLKCKNDVGELICEVKTINTSKEELEQRKKLVAREGFDSKLNKVFIEKLESTILQAKTQISNYNVDAQKLVFLIIHYDDFFVIYNDEYKTQISLYLKENFENEVVAFDIHQLRHEYIN